MWYNVLRLMRFSAFWMFDKHSFAGFLIVLSKGFDQFSNLKKKIILDHPQEIKFERAILSSAYRSSTAIILQTDGRTIVEVYIHSK